jgi:HPt (histidine-containing phosphotransfer) domain-containing protein
MLSGKFLERTAAQAVTLRILIDSLQAGDVASMHEIAHKIHGSGAMLDFPAVSECAGEIERLSERLLAESASAPTAGAQIRERLLASIQQLARAIDSAAKNHAAR